MAACKSLQTFDRKEIQARQTVAGATDDKHIQEAQDSAVILIHEKEQKFDHLYKTEKAYHEELRKFSDFHGLWLQKRNYSFFFLSPINIGRIHALEVALPCKVRAKFSRFDK